MADDTWDDDPHPLEDTVAAVLDVLDRLNDYNSAFRHWNTLHENPELASAYARYGTVEDAMQEWRESFSALQAAIHIAEALVEQYEYEFAAVHHGETVRDLGIEATC